jgi:hypothetical protein
VAYKGRSESPVFGKFPLDLRSCWRGIGVDMGRETNLFALRSDARCRFVVKWVGRRADGQGK